MLSDLPVQIKSGQSQSAALKQQIMEARETANGIRTQIMSGLDSDESAASREVVFLVRDSVQSYGLFHDQKEIIDYENALGLAKLAESRYADMSSTIDERRRLEIASFFKDLESTLEQKSEYASMVQIAGAIERDLAENLSQEDHAGSGNIKYFDTIKSLLQDVVTESKAGNYNRADELAVSAYLDNYEYLESPIERHDPELMETIEVEMREELRQIIKEHQSATVIEDQVNSILEKLDRAQALLAADPASTLPEGTGSGFANIEGLAAGFGTYSGERRSIGEADDPAKEKVRYNIDQIRVGLDNTLSPYKGGDAQGSLNAARSAYLTSYENIEIPLRPINPDFTLEMEIKFAELRNLIQSGAPYSEVEGKVIEIRKGLDESERLVSGTGIIAPALAFSTSFSIVFREGLESALIVGAILTYLEASRNDRFKKHVYYGIVLAFAATAVTWFVAQFIIDISGASKAMIEAIAGVSAVAVLFWVSFWILNKVETKKWIEFVKAKVWKATATGSVMVFVMLSFFTVYREGFETVLFYQAMLSFAKYMEGFVALGLFSGLGVIIAVTFIIRKLGKKLPLRVLFGLTMGIGAYMSIAFMGNAVREFQEVGYISTTHLIGIIPRLDINMAAMTGIHPTLESVLAQVILLGIYLVGSTYVLVIKPRRSKAIESARKSRGDLHRPAESAKSKRVDLD
jgi:high-affinity iron transporter